MKCKVILKNSDGGEFFSDGDVEYFENGFNLLYKIGSDDGKIILKNGELTQERSGSVALKMLFKCGEQTQCTLGEGEMQGSFPVYTQNLTVEYLKEATQIFLIYYLGEERMTLEISVKNI